MVFSPNSCIFPHPALSRWERVYVTLLPMGRLWRVGDEGKCYELSENPIKFEVTGGPFHVTPNLSRGW